MAGIKANEISREELLTRDVYILFQENRELKLDNETLKKQNLRYEKIIGRMKAELEQFKEKDDGESFEDIAFYIHSQRKSMKLSLNEFGKLFGISGTTVENYEKQKGGFNNAIKFSDKIRRYRKENGTRI